LCSWEIKCELKDKHGTARRENEVNIMMDLKKKGKKSIFLKSDSSGYPIR